MSAAELTPDAGTHSAAINTAGSRCPRPSAVSATNAATPATLYPVRDAVLYVPTLQYGMPGKGFQGEMLYSGQNPPYGAMLTYYLEEGIKTLKQKRVDAEKAAEKTARPIRYPTPDELRAEAEEEPPAVLLTVSNSGGTPIRVMTISAPASELAIT